MENVHNLKKNEWDMDLVKDAPRELGGKLAKSSIVRNTQELFSRLDWTNNIISEHWPFKDN